MVGDIMKDKFKVVTLSTPKVSCMSFGAGAGCFFQISSAALLEDELDLCFTDDFVMKRMHPTTKL